MTNPTDADKADQGSQFLFIVRTGGLAAVVIATAVMLFGGSPAPAFADLLLKAIVFGLVAGVAASVGRGICSDGREPPLLAAFGRGDIGSLVGAVLGVVVVGVFAPAPPPPVLAQIAGPTLKHGQYDIAKQRGKVVLVDFWATWCGPCIQELPRVRALYDKYHGDGLEIVGVALERESGRLEPFLAKTDLPWPQIVYDPEKSNPLANRYKVEGIPYMMVVDRNGMIVARDVRGGEAERAVRAALADQASDDEGPLRLVLVGLMHSKVWVLAVAVLLAGIAGAVVEGLIRVRVQKRPRVAQ